MLDRLIGVLSFNGTKYQEIAKDKSATTQAGIIIALALLIEGFISGFIEVNDLAGTTSANMVLGIGRAAAVLVSGLIAWAIAAWVIAFVAKLLGGNWSLISPEQGLQDRASGTYLVPRYRLGDNLKIFSKGLT